MMDFLAMDGYAVFVWSSYGLMALVFLGLWTLARRKRVRAERDLARLEGRGGRRS